MFVKKLWIIGALLCSSNVWCAESQEEEKVAAEESAETKSLATDVLLIFLDESEYFASLQPSMGMHHIHAVSSDVIKALEQRAAPILASTSLIYNVFFENNSKTAQEFRDSFVQFAHSWKADFFGRSLVLLTPRKAQMSVVDVLLRHKKQDDVYKNVSTTLASMKRMYDGFSDDQIEEIIKYFSEQRNLEVRKKQDSDIHKARQYEALYIRALAIKQGRAEQGKKHKAGYDGNFISVYEQQGNNLNVKIKEWKEKNQKDLEANLLSTLKKVMFADEDSSYAVYINGHGDYQKKIAGVSFETLTKAFSFFERGRRVALVVLKSCYAAGANIKKLEEEVRSTIKTMSFPVAIQGITDSVVVAKEDISFTKFVNNVTQHSVLPSLSSTALTFEQALEPIMVPQEEDVKGADKLINQAQIKFPSLPWMLLGGESKRLVAINEVLSKARKKPLNVNSFFRIQELLGVLFYAQKVPFMLEINGIKVPYLVSMVPGDATHYLAGISMHSLGGPEIVKQLYSLFDTMRGASEKIFFIKTIAGNDNAVVQDLLVRIKGDDFAEKKEKIIFYVMVNGILYKRGLKGVFGERISDKQDPRYKEYEELKERALKETEQDRSDIENLERVIGNMAKNLGV